MAEVESTTPNYKLIKPVIGGSVDVWGGHINGNLDIIDTRMKLNETTAGNSMQRSSTDVKQRTATQHLFYDTTVVTDPSQQSAGCLMSNGAVRWLINTLMPIGTIIMWVGTHTSIPYGWALCNGQVVNGHQTPNLLDRFVMGAGGTFGAGYMGGDYTLTYSGGVTGGHVLTWSEMPVHSHAASQGTHVHNVVWTTTANEYGLQLGSTSYAGQLARNVVNGIDTGAASAGPIAIGDAGGNWAHDHPIAFTMPWSQYWPRFYAIVFIMRVIPF